MSKSYRRDRFMDDDGGRSRKIRKQLQTQVEERLNKDRGRRKLPTHFDDDLSEEELEYEYLNTKYNK